MLQSFRTAGGRPRGRSTVLLACALISVSALLPVACGSPSGTDTASTAAQKAAVSPKDDEAAVRKAYAAFEAAGKGSDPAAIDSLISKGSKDYYEKMREFALTATKAQLTKKRLVDQVTVLGMRATTKASLLRNGDLEDLVAASISGDDAPVQGIDVAKAKITISGDTAKLVDATDPEVTIDLVRESTAWKVDVQKVFDDLDEALTGLVEMSGKSKTAFVEQSMAQQVGSAKKAKKLWTPVGEA